MWTLLYEDRSYDVSILDAHRLQAALKEADDGVQNGSFVFSPLGAAGLVAIPLALRNAISLTFEE
ncbi:hypothetical protein [Naasia lichenicola]|uniref:Uncharacterized protein n=1 Tax=Naasia lichenicola TaxID=2565933 RepID=A0A4S4FIA3_9MICO|nr:hypothetical protein [Naasia lichenicola]THG30050.1 hypothetical protein E6C64_15545 [Naasia lichenicola]